MPYTHLTADERESVVHFRSLGQSFSWIGRHLGRDRTTISREFKRNCDAAGKYSAIKADRKARHRRHTCRLSWKLDYAPLKNFVLEKIQLKWSPEQISGQLPQLFPADARMRVSVTTIYTWILANKKQGGMVYRSLRQSSKKRRKRYGTGLSRTPIAGRKSIEQRPLGAKNRTRLGHWESDTVEGRKGTGYLVTHVERKTGYVVVGLMKDKQAATLNAGTLEAFHGIPCELIRTLTTDNGTEFSGHRLLEKELACSIYFAAPRSPWQRGQNENTNGLLRQYFPKGSDFSKLTNSQIAQAVEELNHRPRKKYNYQSPHDLFMPKIRALQI